jgi:uncharacterized membrane protein
MSRADTQFSKVRLETLCDGIFAIAMTQIAIALTSRRLAARR